MNKSNNDIEKDVDAQMKISELELKISDLLLENKEYKNLYHNSPLSYQSLDANGNFLNVNQAWLKSLGYSREDVIGHNFGEFLEPNWVDHFIINFPRLKSLGEVMGIEFKMVKKSGEKILISLSGSIGRDTKGDFLQSYCVIQDITQSRSLEIALEKSEERFRLAMDANCHGLWDWDVNEGEIYYSPGYFTMLGCFGDQGSCNLEFWKERVHPDDRDVIFKANDECIENHRNDFEVEFRMQHKDGQWRWILGRGMAISRGADGRALRLIGTHTDITQHKEMESSLRESETKYRSMMEAMVDPVYICSSDLKIQYMNPAMLNRVGSNAIGESCFNALHDLDERCPWCQFKQLNSFETYDLDILSPKDNRSYHTSNTLIPQSDGSVLKLTVYRDTTVMKQIQDQLQQSQKMESIGTLAGGIAHDFNNILTAIIGYSEIVRYDCPPGSAMSHGIDQVLKSGIRATELVKQILAFSRQVETDQSPINPVFIIKEAINMLRASLPTTITIEQDIDKDVGIILADPTKIHQILMNLCTNAFHAMEIKGGTLTISLQAKTISEENFLSQSHLKSGKFLQLSIRDTGGGISSGVKKKIFDPYFTTKEVDKGTGMGLAVVHGIVQSYGGSITCDSQLGKGTVFHVTLPLVEEEPLQEDVTLEIIQGGDEHILVVDDEKALVEMTKALLERKGYRVTTSTNSIDALAFFRNQPEIFDLMITDQTMPGMTGVNLSQKILQIRPDLPIILCTGYSNIISEEKVKEMGIKGFAMKPLASRDLTVMIRELLDIS